MNTLISIIIACSLITCCVFAALFLLYFKKHTLSKITFFLISLSAGTLMGGAFLHLLPEAIEESSPDKVFLITLTAFILFFLMEKILRWRHCHKEKCPVHTFGYMNLIGDSLHNFLDGLVIAGTFLVDPKLGIITTLAVAFHEIPQEIGDFGVLIHAGFKRKKALLINLAVASTVVLGGITGYFASFQLDNLIPNLLPFATGGFIYVAASDLIPEIKEESDIKKSIKYFSIFLLGIIIMLLIKVLLHSH